MLARVARAIAVVLLAGAAMTGCAGTPEPQASTPAPLTDEQAFAAAEETYRAYVDALNQVDLSDPTTFEPVYALTTGDANADERKSLSQMHADGWTVSGKTVLDGFVGESVNRSAPALSVTGLACMNVSQVQVTDAEGASVSDPQRPDAYTLRVVLQAESHRFVIASSSAVSEPPCE